MNTKYRMNLKRLCEIGQRVAALYQKSALIGILCLFLLFHMNEILLLDLKAEDYPSECHLTIRTEEGDSSKEILLLYQLGSEYDPIEEQICWASYLDEKQKQYIKDGKEIPVLIMELERKLKKEEPYALLSLNEEGSAEQIVSPGVYLLIQESPRKVLIQSSLVSIPYMNEEGDRWIGDREIVLKTAPVPEDSKTRTPDTGDGMQPGVLAVAFLLSAASAGMLIRQGRNKKLTK